MSKKDINKNSILPEALKGISTDVNVKIFKEAGGIRPDDIENIAVETFFPVQDKVPPMPVLKISDEE